MKYAYVEDGTVVEAVRVDPFSIFNHSYAAQFVEAPDEVEPGWLFDGSGYAPPQQEATNWPRFFGNHKLDLFTTEEQLAVVTTTMSDPVVKLMYDRLLGAAYLSYEDPETEQGLSLLVDRGLLTPERKVEIVQQMQPR